MDQQSNSNNDLLNAQQEKPQENLFYDMADMSGYDRNLRNGRIWLYVLAGIQVVIGIFEYNSIDQGNLALFALIADVLIGVMFLSLALWSRKKPVAAFLSALIFYIVVQLLMMIGDPKTIVSGLLIKVLFVTALIKAYRDAKENDAIKKALS